MKEIEDSNKWIEIKTLEIKFLNKYKIMMS